MIPYDIPTPQADNIYRIFDLIKLIKEDGDISKESITSFFKFTYRQTGYYVNAAKYLDLIKVNRNKLALTITGESICSEESFINRQIMFAKQILKTGLFNDVMRNYIRLGKHEDDYIISRIKYYDSKIASDMTAKRRSITIKSWCNFIIKVTD